jgi:hypothetical protein
MSACCSQSTAGHIQITLFYTEKKFLYAAVLLSFGVIGAMKYGLVTINHEHRNGKFRSAVMEKNLFH